MFYVGQKVVCVKGVEWSWLIPKVTKGEIYVVARTGNLLGDVPGLWVEGVHGGNGELFGFFASRFRPLQETGMSMLRAILADPKKELEAA